VRRRIKTHPHLRKEFRRRRSSRWGRALTLSRFLIPLVIVGILMAGYPVALVTQWMVLWTTGMTLARIQQIVGATRNPASLWLWYGWPVSDDDLFTHLRGLILRTSTWLGVDWLMFGVGVAWIHEDISLAAAAPVLALAQWAAGLAAALWLVQWKPRFPFALLISPLWVLIFLAVRFADERNGFAVYINAVSNTLYVGTPGGWLAQGWSYILNGNPAGWAVLLGLGGVAIAGLFSGAKAARKAFNPNALFGYEPTPAELDHEAPATTTIQDARSAKSETVHRETAPVDLGFVRSRLRESFETPAGTAFTRRSPIENGIGWFLTARQRVLIDFMAPGGMPWSRRWIFAAGLLAATLVLRATWPHLAAFPAIGAAVVLLPVMGGRWLGFEALRTFQTQIGLTAYVPVGFGELSRLVLKINALQCAAAFPLVLAAVWLGFEPVGAPTWWALDYSARALALIVALQPIWLLVKFSSNTNDSSSGRLFLLGIVVVVIGGLIIGISLCVTALMIEKTSVALICLGALSLLTHVVLALYGWAWGRGSFDLMAKMK
jgi:hypothetical protein